MKSFTKHIGCILFLSFFAYSSFAQSENQIKGKYLIVLDIQKLYITNTISDSGAQKLIMSINSVIEKADTEKVIYIKSIATALSISLKGFKVDTLPNLELDERLKIVSKHIFKKDQGNAFTSEELICFLNKHSAREFIVVGLLAEQCVLKTVLGGKEKGYEMFIVPEAIIGKTLDSKSKTIAKLLDRGIKIINCPESGM